MHHHNFVADPFGICILVFVVGAGVRFGIGPQVDTVRFDMLFAPLAPGVQAVAWSEEEVEADRVVRRRIEYMEEDLQRL
jgi:hypothetical protein